MSQVNMEKIVALCKRRGFVYPSSEIYGGLSATWDYGPLGAELKRNIQDLWWREMVRRHDEIVGLDAAILMHPRTWEASGHVENFSDPLVDCKKCKTRYRADQLEESVLAARKCPACGGEMTQPRDFNLMFTTTLGAVEAEGLQLYLRPETAQGIFVNFKNVLDTSRVRIPFGIAQVGKAFRNEITTRNFIFRTCEFEQMEMQYFVQPGSEDESFAYWKQERLRWYEQQLGIRLRIICALSPTHQTSWHIMRRKPAILSIATRTAGKKLKGSIRAPTTIWLATANFVAEKSNISTRRPRNATRRMS